jgi:hypothetical protein
MMLDQNPLRVKEVMETDPEVAQAIERLRSGEISLNTGEDGLVPWTDEAKQNFYRILQREIAPLFAAERDSR